MQLGYDREGLDSIVTSEQLMLQNELRNTEFYNDYLVPQDTAYQLGCVIASRKNWCAAFTSLRPQHGEPFGPAEVDIVRVLFPHLQRAMEFHEKMAAVLDQHQATLDTLDKLPTGILLLAADGRILLKNTSAARMLAENDGIVADKHQVIVASHSTDNKDLHARIANCTRLVESTGFGSGVSALRIVRPSGKRPYSLLIMRAVEAPVFAQESKAAVIIFITDPEQVPAKNAAVFRSIFGLTRTESLLADLLARGITLVEAAEQLQVTHNTVRSHLQRIYEKTGTSHQGDLVRLLLTGVPNILRKPHPNG